MPAYWATINGENFLVELEGELGKNGLFAHRCVIADDPATAEQLAVQLLRDDQSLRPLIRNSPDDPPTMKLEQLIEIEAPDPDCPPRFDMVRNESQTLVAILEALTRPCAGCHGWLAQPCHPICPCTSP